MRELDLRFSLSGMLDRVVIFRFSMNPAQDTYLQQPGKKTEKTQNCFSIHWCSMMFIYSWLFNSIHVFIPMFVSQQWIKIPTPWGGVSRVHAEADGTKSPAVGMRGLQDILRGWESDQRQRYIFSVINHKYDCFQWQPQYPHFIPFWSCDWTLGLVLQ